MNLKEYSKHNKNFSIGSGQTVIDSKTGCSWIINGRFIAINRRGDLATFYRLAASGKPYKDARTETLNNLLNNYTMPDGKKGNN